MEQEPAGSGADQPALDRAQPADRDTHLTPRRGVQPSGEVDLCVLRPALLGHLRVPLGEGERRGLLLQVVEEAVEALVPPHPRTLTGGGLGVNHLWTTG